MRLSGFDARGFACVSRSILTYYVRGPRHASTPLADVRDSAGVLDNPLGAALGVYCHRAVLSRETDRVVGAVHLHGAAVLPGIAAGCRAARNGRVSRSLQAHTRPEILRQRNR